MRAKKRPPLWTTGAAIKREGTRVFEIRSELMRCSVVVRVDGDQVSVAIRVRPPDMEATTVRVTSPHSNLSVDLMGELLSMGDACFAKKPRAYDASRLLALLLDSPFTLVAGFAGRVAVLKIVTDKEASLDPDR